MGQSKCCASERALAPERHSESAAGRAAALWMIFPVIFMALYASHFTLLRVPYYWDEAGYYIPAAWDFFRTGSLIPTTTLSNAHPPLPSIYLALWWKASALSRGDARGRADGGRAGAAWPCGGWRCAGGRGLGRVLDRAAHRPLSHLVCAEHAGPRRHFCRRVLAVGMVYALPNRGRNALGCRACGFRAALSRRRRS
jgi:hypothetical protein